MDVRSVREKYTQRHSSLLTVEKLAERSNIQWGQRVPSIRQNFEPFPTIDILNIRGIPPLMGSPNGPNTKTALIKIIIELLKDLPPASNLSEGEEQVKTTLKFVYNSGAHQRIMTSAAEKFRQINFGQMSDLEIVDKLSTDFDNNSNNIPGFGFSGPLINPLDSLIGVNNEKMFFTRSYVSHALIIGRNGSIQIIRIPSSEKLIEMLKNDSRAKQHTLEAQPLDEDVKNGIPPVFFGDETELFTHLRNEELLKSRITESKDSDVNKLFRNAPFDLPRHIRAGRLNVILDKVGADGLTVWQNTSNDFYRSLSRFDSQRKDRNARKEKKDRISRQFMSTS